MYLGPFQNVNLRKTQTSEKKGVVPQGSALVPALAAVNWGDRQTPQLPELSRVGIAALMDEQIPRSILVKNSISKQEQHLKA